MMSLRENYFPTVDSSLRIQINELTSVNDVKHIWSEIEKKQRMFKGNNRLATKEKYANHDRDKFAYELRKNKKMAHNDIKKELEHKGFGSYDYEYISKIIKAYKDFIEES